MSGGARWRLALLLGIVCGVMHVVRLATLPAYFGGDEAHFANQAYAIATTGRDLGGHASPLFVNLTDPWLGGPPSTRWYQPIFFYLTAAVLRVAPLAEWSVRLPAAIVGAIDVVLVYAVAARIFGRRRDAVLAALLLALSPAHIIFSRQATDYICVIPFALGWLLCVCRMPESGRAQAFGTGLLLGVGIYSHLSAWMLMPALLAVTFVVLLRTDGRLDRCAFAAAGFLVPVLPAVWWIAQHPQMLHETLARYAPREGQSHVTAALRAYADYFDPRVLFVRGGESMTASTHRSGVFPAAVALLLPAGLVAAVSKTSGHAVIRFVLVCGLVIAPIPAALGGERHTIQRALLLLPFGVLLAVYGAHWLLSLGRSVVTVVVLTALVTVPLQAVYFWYDYRGHYQHRSAFYFDPVDMKDVASYVIAADGVRRLPAVYLSLQLDDVESRWRFHLMRRGRQDLLERSRCLDCEANEAGSAPPGSLAVLYADRPALAPYLAQGRWALATTIKDLDGREATAILQRVR